MNPKPSGYDDDKIRRRWLPVLFAVGLSLFFVVTLTAEVWARSSGGRYGGRAGFSQSRSRPSGGGWTSSAPRPAPVSPYNAPTSPGYSPPMSGPGFGFFPFLLPFLGWGGGARGGSSAGGGFSFGGIFTLLIILGIVVIVGRVLLQNLATARRSHRDGAPSAPLSEGRYAVVKCQIAMLSTARSLQHELQTFANAASTDTVVGLAAALQDAVMAIQRYSQYWRYGAVQVHQAETLDDAERAFNQMVARERAKLSAELTVNVDGVRRQAARQDRTAANEVGQNLVVTLIVASSYPAFEAYHTPSVKDIEDTLQRLGTLLTSDLLALEVIWSPENPDDTLTEDELIAEYPELSAL
ncbi:MAG TPA: DUF1517 domain-containing protein [Candidatus Tectomicrobia bacterium]|nr:DUF1517 domain-containing protein [Candidatus Tectomicrobia bacterium]